MLLFIGEICMNFSKFTPTILLTFIIYVVRYFVNSHDRKTRRKSMKETKHVELIDNIPSSEREYLKKDVSGCDMYRGSIVRYIRTDGEKVLCEDGSGRYYVPLNKVRIY
jgi:hypothetical protein